MEGHITSAPLQKQCIQENVEMNIVNIANNTAEGPRHTTARKVSNEGVKHSKEILLKCRANVGCSRGSALLLLGTGTVALTLYLITEWDHESSE